MPHAVRIIRRAHGYPVERLEGTVIVTKCSFVLEHSCPEAPIGGVIEGTNVNHVWEGIAIVRRIRNTKELLVVFGPTALEGASSVVDGPGLVNPLKYPV